MLRPTHILCPIDLSDISRRTFERAVALARPGGGSVTVLYVAPAPGAAAMPYVGPEAVAAFPLPEIDREQLTATMKALLGLPGNLGVPVTLEITEAPSVHREILAQAGRLGADLIVMGTHGRRGVDRLMLGSVAQKVLRTSVVPVLTVPPSAARGASPESVFRRIVCGVDFSGSSANGLEQAAAIAEGTGAELTVVHVVEAPPVVADPMIGVVPEPPDYRDTLVRDATRHLHDFIARHVGHRARVTGLVTKGTAAIEILRTAGDHRADLIVLGTHGRNAVDRLLFGSTADRVVRQAACPVLTVRDARPAVRKAAS
jgi:nucleotide-binding universal stress UspA family protein